MDKNKKINKKTTISRFLLLGIELLEWHICFNLLQKKKKFQCNIRASIAYIYIYILLQQINVEAITYIFIVIIATTFKL